MAEYSIQTPYEKIAKKKGMTSGELNALRHFWLVQQIGRKLADLREGNKKGASLKIGGINLGGLLSSDDDPVDYWNNEVADSFLGQEEYGLLSMMMLEAAASNIKKRKHMRNPQFPWIVNEN
jgi:hypothetical protein